VRAVNSAPDFRRAFSFPAFRFSIFFFITALVLLAPLSVRAAATLSETDKADIRRVEAYLNSISTMDADFLQMTSLGDFAEGRIYLSRPGRVRIDYDPPNPILIVANYGTIKYVDRQLDQISHFSLDDTPAGVLLDEKVRLLDEKFTITAVEREAATLRIGLTRSADPLQGMITLVFDAKPLKLRKWEVIDAQGLLTVVSLQGARFAIPLKDTLFRYDPPEKKVP